MIYDDILSKCIEKVEKENDCSIHEKSAVKLIDKVKSEYAKKKPVEGFKKLVEQCAEGFELPFNYREVASSYISKHRARRKKEKKVKEAKRVQIVQKRFITEKSQTRFAFERENEGIEALHLGEN